MVSISSSLALLPRSDFPSLFSNIPQMEGPLGETEDKRLYFATNEDHSDRTINILQRMPLRGNIVLAVSGIFALNILAARIEASRAHGSEISGLVIVDRSPLVERFWIELSKIITEERRGRKQTRIATILQIKELISTKKDYFFDTSSPQSIQSNFLLTYNLRRFREEIQSGVSFASTDEKFNSIQEFFSENRVRFLRLDITNPSSFQALGAVLRVNQLYVDTAYFSNILQCTDDVANFQASTEEVMSPDTIVVDTVPVCNCEIEVKGYVQRVREREGLSARELFIPAVQDYFSRALIIISPISFALNVARRTIAATYSYFMGTSSTQEASTTYLLDP
jgi:hypothetical protein